MASSSSAVPALAGAPAPANSSSAAASAIAAVKSFAKSTKQRINLSLGHTWCRDAVQFVYS
jgi:hypothetical protein